MAGIYIPYIWPWVCSFITVVCYLKIQKEDIDLAGVFVSISIINVMRSPFIFLSLARYNIGEMDVALTRLNDFFNQPEARTLSITEGSEKGKIEVKGDFCRSMGDPTNCLTNMEIEVKPGELIAVVGRVGCGKSTLFHAILGELYPKGNSVVKIGGRVGYLDQTS